MVMNGEWIDSDEEDDNESFVLFVEWKGKRKENGGANEVQTGERNYVGNIESDNIGSVLLIKEDGIEFFVALR